MRNFIIFISLLLGVGAVVAQRLMVIQDSETDEEISATIPDGLVITNTYQEETGEIIASDTIYADNDTSNVCDAETIDVESLNEKKPVTQHKWTKYEYVDTCTTRYAVVHDWNGRCGIYDLEKKENITELEYRALRFSKMMNLDDGSQATVFYGYKGHREGIVSVDPNGEVITITRPDKELIYSLESCRTIDKKISNMSRELLKKDMKKYGGHYGQVLVMETQTGNIKAWVALEDEYRNGNITDAPLYKHQLCSDPQKLLWSTMALVESNTSLSDSVDTKCGADSIGDAFIKDHIWPLHGFGKITYLDGFKVHSNIAMARALEKTARGSVKHEWWRVADCPREMDALEVAMLYNLVALDGKKAIAPSVNTDSIRIVPTDGYAERDIHVLQMMRQCLKATLQDGGIGSKWTTKKVDISGDYVSHNNCRPTLYDDNLKDFDQYHFEGGIKTYNQVIFTGYFPSDKPRYTICVSMDRDESPAVGLFISNTVNKLAEYLNKH